MIRQANKYDKIELIEFMRQYRNESQIKIYKDIDNSEYVNKLLDSILAGKGIIYIAPGKGLIMGVIAPILWCDKTYGLYELAWWVKPEFRNGMTGYRLVKAYIEHGNKLKESGRIKLFTLSKLSNSTDLDYARLGFTKTDENWMQ